MDAARGPAVPLPGVRLLEPDYEKVLPLSDPYDAAATWKYAKEADKMRNGSANGTLLFSSSSLEEALEEERAERARRQRAELERLATVSKVNQ